MSRSSLNFPYDRPAPEPHFIPGYTGHCPFLADQVGITYPLATYLILQNRPDVASILSDMRLKSNKHESNKEHSSKQGYKGQNGKSTEKNGQRNGKSTEKNGKRKKWVTGNGQLERGSGYRCGSGIHPNSEVDIAYGKHMKKEGYECGSEGHKHLHFEGNAACKNKQERDGDGDSRRTEEQRHSEDDKSSRIQESALKDKFIEAQKKIFYKIVSEVEKEKLKDTHTPCCNSLLGYKKTHC